MEPVQVRDLSRFDGRGALRALVWTLLFCAALTLTYWRVVNPYGPRVSGRYDVYRYFGPNAYFMDMAVHHGEFPLWNPLVYCGMPFAANPQTAAFYPPNIARSLLNVSPTPGSTQRSLVILMALHLLLGAAGAYRLARAHGTGRAGAYAAAVAFTFSALMVRRACEYHFLYTLNWLPWILLFVKRAIDRPALRGKIASGAAAGALLGMAVLGGFLQILPYMCLAIGAYAVVWRLLNPRKNLTGDLAAAGVAMIVSAGLAAALLLPAAELSSFAARQPDAQIGQYSHLSRAGAGAFLQNLVVYAGTQWRPEAVRGFGVAGLVLAVAGLLLLRRRDVLAFFIPVLILVDCSFGPPLPFGTLLERLTPFATSATTRAWDVALLPLSVLAGFGVDALARPGRSRLGLAARTALVALAGAAVVWELAESLSRKVWLDVSPAAAGLPVAALAVMALTPWLAGRKRVAVPLQFILPALIFCETFAWNRQYVPALLAGGSPTETAAPEWPRASQNQRYVDRRANNALFGLKPLINGYDPLHLRAVRDVISGPPRGRVYHRLVTDREPTADNHRGNLFLKRPFWLLKTWAPGPLPPKDRLFPAATTVFLDGEPDLSVPKIAPEAVRPAALASMGNVTQRLRVPERAIPANMKRSVRFRLDLPRGNAAPAGAVHSALIVEYASSCPVTIELTLSDRTAPYVQPGKTYKLGPTRGQTRSIQFPLPDFPRMDAVLLVRTAGRSGEFEYKQANVQSDLSDDGDKLRGIQWRANGVSLTVADAPANRILLFTDADYPGWHAAVDGEKTSIYRANDAFKAILIPPGTHQVQFKFRPRTVYAGLGISGATLGLLLALAFLFSRRDAETQRASVVTMTAEL